ncbi:glycosyl hydrolase family 8 [Rhodobacter sp. NSM]|uniref:glycosyl hydrolase family 8 n=1 Tax=Rhodobacter sp. NSM TaxID=3457501 RepID=UPI003FD39DB7
MNRRTFMTALTVTLAGGGVFRAGAQGAPAFSLASGHPLQEAWQAWKRLCLNEEGRVIDAPQSGASHSEGQGYGLRLAAAFGDEEAFRRIFAWTEGNLALREDGLLSWRYLPETGDPVPDQNNASDGDLFYAWALIQGGILWNEPGFHERARIIGRALEQGCLAGHPDGSERRYLLPAAYGFASDEGVTLNPSYFMPRAMREVGMFAEAPALVLAARDGLELMNAIAGSALLPDWLRLTPEGPADAPGLSADCGYDALRIPLYLCWSGMNATPAQVRFREIHRRAARVSQDTPTVFEEGTGQVRETSDQPGYRALVALNDCVLSGTAGAALPDFDAEQPYFPATLHLMALVAQAEFFPKCLPI